MLEKIHRYLFAVALFLAPLLRAQNPGPVYQTNTAPSGSCSTNIAYLVRPTGLIYTCQNGTWGIASGSGSGGTYCAGAGTNTITCAGSPVPTSYAAGMVVTLLAGGTNTGATTLNIGSPALGAKPVISSSGAALAGGEIVSGSYYSLSYNGTSFVLGGVITLSGDTSGPSSATVTTKLNGTALSGLATGILKNTTATGVPSIATSADVIATFSGTCSSSTVLVGDGTCGAISSAYTAITGVPANTILGNNTGSTANAIALATTGTGSVVLSASPTFTGTVGAAAITATGQLTVSLNNAASTPPVAITGTWFTGGSGTSTKPSVLIEPAGTSSTTWDTSGSGLGVNGPSGCSGKLLDLKVAGTEWFNVQCNGQVNVAGNVQSTGGFYGAPFTINASGDMRAPGFVAWTATNPTLRWPSDTPDVGVSRVSAGIIGIGTGAAGSHAGTLQAATIIIDNSSFTFNGKTCTIVAGAISCS